MSSQDVSVHRYKFSDWTPSPIKSIAVDKFSGMMAVGREDGDIEITNPAETWYTQARIQGKEGFGLKGLAFSLLKSERGRLFGVSLCGFVFEVDFASLSLKNIRDSYGGGVWSLACSPRAPLLALGCEDKTVKIFSYGGSGPAEYERSFPSAGSRVLCVAFDPVLPRVMAGCADGTIRCYEEQTGRSLFRLTGDVLKGMKSAACIWSLMVLDDATSTIVSGDNQGKVQFWDGKTGDLFCSIKQHAAAVQCLAVSDDQNSIFASGVDSRVICVQRISQQQQLATPTPDTAKLDNTSGSDRWVYTSAHRPHSHDVYALAVASRNSSQSVFRAKAARPNALYPSSRKNSSVLVSGGMDCKLCMYSMTDFAGSRPNWILPVPCTGVASASLTDRVDCASDACSGLVSIKHRTHVDLWRLRCGEQSPNACENCCRIQLKPPNENESDVEVMLGRDHLHSAVLSASGDFLALTGGTLDGSSSGLRLFRVVDGKGDDGTKVLPVSLDAAVERATNAGRFSCQQACFSSNDQSLAVVVSSSSGALGAASNVSILLLDLSSARDDENSAVTLHHTLKHSTIVDKALSRSEKSNNSDAEESTHGLESTLMLSIKSLSFSADDRWLAVASSSKRLYVYEIDRLSLHWVLPLFPSPITCMSFHPSSPNSIIVSTSSSSTPFLIYDVQEKSLAAWSKENTDAIPEWSTALGVQNFGAIQNITFDPSCESAFMLYGQGFSIFIDLNKPIVSEVNMSGDGDETKCQYIHKGQVSFLSSGGSDETEQVSRKKRKRSKDESLDITSNGKRKGKSNDTDRRNFSVIKAYRSLVCAALLGDREMLVIENPWVRILENLPATLSRKRFGT